MGDEACPQCRSNGGDKTSNHLILFEDGGKFCNKCGYTVKGASIGAEENHAFGIDEVALLPSLEVRGIKAPARRKFGCTTAVSTTDGKTVTDIFYPRHSKGKLTGYKIRVMPKDFSKKIGDTKNSDLWGRHAFEPTKTLVITEGEEDAMAVYQAIIENTPKQYVSLTAVCSLANGSNSVTKELHDSMDYINKFKEIVLCFDDDNAGNKALNDAIKLIPQAKVALLSEKDANDMILKGKAKDLHRAVIFDAKVKRPDGVVSVADVWADAIKPVELGLSWPWPTVTKITYGIRRKEMYGYGAGTGCGKTEGFKELIHWMLFEHKLPVALFFLEEEPSMTAKVIAGKHVNKRFHVPDGGWDKEELEAAMTPIKDTCFMYDHKGVKDWDSIKDYIRYYVVVMGIKDIFLDNLTAMVSDSDDVNKDLSKIMSEMSGLCEELDFTFHYISHLNTPNGKPHEEGGRVTVANFRGSRTIGFWSNYLFGYERNQQAEDEEEKNTTTFRVLKDRYTGAATGKTIKLFYDHDTGRMLENFTAGVEGYL